MKVTRRRVPLSVLLVSLGLVLASTAATAATAAPARDPAARGDLARRLARVPRATAAHAGATARGAAPTGAQSVPDGAGGMYVTWPDGRDGTADVYLQRFTGAGAVAAGWPANGLPVCTKPGEQFSTGLVSDGANGVIVAWSDYRDGNVSGDEYAQRVSSAGTAMWTAGGRKLISGVILPPVLAPDGSGGLLAAWAEQGATDFDIRAVRLDGATGAVATGWGTSGVSVCSAAGDQTGPGITSDGAGGAIIAWQDLRGASDAVYGQRLNGAGVAQWTADGAQIDPGTGQPSTPAICGDGAGGAIITWLDTFGVMGQRVNGAAAAQWGAAGVTVSPTPLGGSTFGNVLVADGLGGAIVAWTNSSVTTDSLYAQRVNGSGARQWGAAPVSLWTSTTTMLAELGEIVPDGTGGAFFVGDDDRLTPDYPDIYAQRVNASGSPQWVANGLTVCNASGAQIGATAVRDGGTGVLIAWLDFRNSSVDVYAQRLDAAGNAQLAANGAAIYNEPGVQIGSASIPDGAGGAFVVWHEKRGGQYDLRARRINSSGAAVTAAVDVCAAATSQFIEDVIADGAGGVIVLWQDERGANTPDLYAQRLNASCVPQWTANGVVVSAAAGVQEDARMVSDGAGGAIIAWHDRRNPSDANIYAQRINGAGTAQWTADGLGVCVVAGTQDRPAIASDGAGGAIISWFDARSFLSLAVYAQRLNGAGSPAWAANGVSVMSTTAFSGGVVGATSDGASGAIVLFSEQVFNLVTFSTSANILTAQRIGPTGATPWGAAGVTVCDAGALIEDAQLVTDNAGGAIVAWSDGRTSTYDVYAQRITSAGAASWTANGVAVCNASDWQVLSQVVADGSGGAILGWSDMRGGGFPDVYAQRINGAGAAQWTANGVALCSAVNGQYVPGVASDGAGGAILAWTDDRTTPVHYIYAGRLGSTGTVMWAADGVTAVTVAAVLAEAIAGHAHLAWEVSTGEPVTVFRRTLDTAWAPLAEVAPDGDGRVVFDDADVVAGTRYGYRLGLRDNGAVTYGGEAWVELPLALSLALAAPRPNPVVGDLTLSFTLPGGAPARLEILDVSGRRVASREVGGLGAGAHTLRFEGLRPGAGLYFVRLVQGARSVSTRAVFTR